MAGAPATSANVASRPKLAGRPPSAIGVAIPSPSVTLWTMKPTIRNVPRASSPTANDEPIASPSPRLWAPMPTATRVASASPPGPAAALPSPAESCRERSVSAR